MSTWIILVFVPRFMLANEPHVDTSLREVATLRRESTLVILERDVSVLDVSSSKAKKRVFDVSRERGAGVLIACSEGKIYVALTPSVYEVVPGGRVRVVATMKGDEKHELGPGEFDRFFRVARGGSVFYFKLYRNVLPSALCRLVRSSGEVTMLECGAAIPASYEAIGFCSDTFGSSSDGIEIDVDVQQETAFLPSGVDVFRRRFNGDPGRSVAIGKKCSGCRVSPNGKKLALYQGVHSSEHPIMVFDLDDQSLVYAPAGMDASWGDENTLYYTDELGVSLLRYDLESGELERILTVDRAERRFGRTKDDRPRVTRAPVSSEDGELIAWGWWQEGKDGDQGYIAVVDLKYHEYRLVPADWSSFCWLE